MEKAQFHQQLLNRSQLPRYLRYCFLTAQLSHHKQGTDLGDLLRQCNVSLPYLQGNSLALPWLTFPYLTKLSPQVFLPLRHLVNIVASQISMKIYFLKHRNIFLFVVFLWTVKFHEQNRILSFIQVAMNYFLPSCRQEFPSYLRRLESCIVNKIHLAWTVSFIGFFYDFKTFESFGSFQMVSLSSCGRPSLCYVHYCFVLPKRMECI